MDELPSSKYSQLHQSAVAEDHTENKGAENKGTYDLNDIVDGLTRVEKEWRLAVIKAMEKCEKRIAENKAVKNLFEIGLEENSKQALYQVEIKQIEDDLQQSCEKGKVKKVEKVKNKIAILHKKAEEKRAVVEAEYEKDIIKIEVAVEKYKNKIAGVHKKPEEKRAVVEVKYGEDIIKVEENAEKLKNKIAEIRKKTEEMLAAVEAERGEDILKVEKDGAKQNKIGTTSTKFFGCFS